MKSKLMTILISAIVIMGILGGCGKKEEMPSPEVTEAPIEEPEEEPLEEPTEMPTEAPVEEATVAEGMSDDLYSFQVQLNGIVYALPEDYSKFAEQGWVLEESGTLEPNQKTLVTVAENGDSQVYFSLVNLGQNVEGFEKCKVGEIQVDEYMVEKGTSIVLPKGITIGDSYDKVVEAYGVPTEESETELTKFLNYNLDTYSGVKINIDKESNIVSEIGIENLMEQKQSKAASTEAVDLGSYTVPTDLGEDLLAFVVQYAGDLYKLPAPVGAFTNNGWVIESDPDEILEAKGSNVSFQLRKDNQVLDAIVKNYSDEAQPMSACYVTRIEYYVNGAEIPLTLPKGISENSTMEEVVAAYGEPVEIEESTTGEFKYLEYGESGASITFVFSEEEETVHKIEVDFDPKTLD